MDRERAEVAFLVSDEDHGRGLGILLLEHLAALGRAHGLTRFEAEVLGHNYGMLRVFRGAGFAVSRRTADGEVSVELRTDVSAAALDAADQVFLRHTDVVQEYLAGVQAILADLFKHLVDLEAVGLFALHHEERDAFGAGA